MSAFILLDISQVTSENGSFKIDIDSKMAFGQDSTNWERWWVANLDAAIKSYIEYANDKMKEDFIKNAEEDRSFVGNQGIHIPAVGSHEDDPFVEKTMES